MEGDKNLRGTIRIEIQNDIVDAMDVDEPQDEVEDGELSEDDTANESKNNNELVEKNNVNIATKQSHKWLNKEGGFATGVDIFSKDEQNKLSVRAQRFGINNDDSKAMTDQQLQELHDSLGITKTDEKIVRFDAVHIRGVEEMSTKDVFGYFSVYGPASIEWINDYSCNVAWSDNVSAARALHGLSKRIKGMEFLDEVNPFVGTKTVVEETLEAKSVASADRSVLLIDNEGMQVEFEETNESQNSTIATTEEDPAIEEDDFVNASDIAIPIPPGYWRFGQPHPKAKSILLRFALRTDRKPFKAEKLSDYYKKYGNPNFGGLRGIITESKKRRFRGNVSPPRKVLDLSANGDNKNPWGGLAQNWSNEDKGLISLEPKEIINPPLVYEQRCIESTGGPSVLERIGNKRSILINDSAEENVNVDHGAVKRKKIVRMRMYADEEQARINRLKSIKKAVKVNYEKDIDNRNVNTLEFQSGPLRFRGILDDVVTDTKPDLRGRLEHTDKRRIDLSSRLGRKQLVSDEEDLPYISKSNRFENRLGSKPLRDESPPANVRKSHDASHKSISLRNRKEEEYYSDEYGQSGYENSRQRSTVKIVVKTRPRPTVASTVTIGKNQFRNLSDRESFRSKTSEPKIHHIGNRDRSTTTEVKDLRTKIPDRSINTFGKKSDRTAPVILRKIKKETSTSASSDSSSESDSEESSSNSSSDDSESSKTSAENEKKNNSLKKSLSQRDNFVKGDKISLKSKDTLRIEVRNENYKRSK